MTAVLFYKTWLETRWRFAIGFVLLLILAFGTVVEYPATAELLSQTHAIERTGSVGRAIAEALAVERDYRGYVWWEWHKQNLVQMWTLFAVLLGSGGLVSRASGASLFTLSLPVSRRQLLGVRAATGAAELLVLAFVPSLVIALLSPAIGQHYGVADALVYGLCLFLGGVVFFSLALLLSTVFDDLWRPLLLACAAAVVIAGCELALRDLAPYGLFRVMSGESYFRSHQVPWLGLFAAFAAALSMLFAANRNFMHRDF